MENCKTLLNPPHQQRWPVFATSSRLIVIECSRLKQATVVAMMDWEAGGDTAVNASRKNLPQHGSCAG